jgi:ribosomal protein L37AE/L43A
MARGDIKKIFADHFDEFMNRFGNRVRPVVIKEVKKILGCGSFANGYAEYKCEKCGEKRRYLSGAEAGFVGRVGKYT